MALAPAKDAPIARLIAARRRESVTVGGQFGHPQDVGLRATARTEPTVRQSGTCPRVQGDPAAQVGKTEGGPAIAAVGGAQYGE